MINILFVCMGNICRSPSAEAVMNSIIEQKKLSDKIRCDSAGTISYHAGESADDRMMKHASKRGYDLTSIARQIQRIDLEHFDYIVTMDEENYENVLTMEGEDKFEAKVSKITDYSRKYNVNEIPDPYYGGPQGFEYVLDLLEDSCAGLLEQVLKEYPEI